mmetsp:Transcript_23230/g.49676  ORF Transcript_23230/g.49676 Transcript_23230/m.49676 type:complete len:166 (+) Transcript_23230:535-1032(+)
MSDPNPSTRCLEYKPNAVPKNAATMDVMICSIIAAFHVNPLFTNVAKSPSSCGISCSITETLASPPLDFSKDRADSRKESDESGIFVTEKEAPYRETVGEVVKRVSRRLSGTAEERRRHDCFFYPLFFGVASTAFPSKERTTTTRSKKSAKPSITRVPMSPPPWE